MKSKEFTELSYDIQAGLGNMDVPDFDQMRLIGMAANLAIHIRGLGEIQYEVLRKVSDHYFNIPSYALKDVLEILAEIEYIQLFKTKTAIKSIIPAVPRFIDLYEGIGDYFTFSELNEHEQGALLIMSELQNKADNKDRVLHKTGMDSNVFTRCIDIGNQGHYIKPIKARGKEILASPFYFADNLDSLADVTAKIGAKDIEVVLDVIKNNQGWPLSMIEKKLEVGGQKLSEDQKNLLVKLCTEGVLKPPSISFNDKSESFVFTPSPGSSRLNSANREIYERAMALVSSVRKGQLLADQYKIKMPVRLLQSLRNKGYLSSNSEAAVQYKNLVHLKVGKLVPTNNGRWQFHLHNTEENRQALDTAISLLNTGELNNLEIDQEARLALSKDESYIQSILSSAELSARKQVLLTQDAKDQFEQLILGI